MRQKEIKTEKGNNKNDILVDVRSEDEFVQQHLPQAINMPITTLVTISPTTLTNLFKGKKVVLYCTCGLRAEKAKHLLKAANIEAVLLEGQLNGWVQAGKELTTLGLISLERQVRIAAGSLVISGVLLGVWFHPYFSIIALLVGAGLVHAGVTGACTLANILLQMPWNNKTEIPVNTNPPKSCR